MQIFGYIALFFTLIDFTTGIYKAIALDRDGMRWDSLESAVWFTAAMICFK